MTNAIREPTEEQLRDALQRQLNAQVTGFKPSDERYNTIYERQDTADAVLCAFGDFIQSNTGSIQVYSVSIDKCGKSDGDIAFCRYRADAEMQGGGVMGNVAVADAFNAIVGVGNGTWASFRQSGERWIFMEAYSSCDIADVRITCR